MNLLEQCILLERLAEKIVSTNLHQLLAILVHRTRGHCDNSDILPPIHGTNATNCLMAIHFWHSKIHEDQMRPPAVEFTYRFYPIDGQPDLESDRAEKLCQQL